MRRIILTAMLACVTAAAGAETFFTYASGYPGDGMVQAFFKEKYFELNTLNRDFIGGEYYDQMTEAIKDDRSVLRGMSLDFGLRAGITEGLTLGLGFLYIFQRLNELDFNNLHTVTLLAEKELWPNMTVMAGVRVPVYHKVSGDVRLTDSNDKLNAIGGISYGNSLWIFDLAGEAVAEQCLKTGTMYLREYYLSFSASVTLYDDPEKQKICLIAEEAGYVLDHEKYYGITWKTVPQVKVFFHNDFNFIAGIELINFAQNLITNQPDKLAYVLKLNYTINSPKRGSGKTGEEGESQEGQEAAAGTYEGVATPTPYIPEYMFTPTPTPAATPIQ